MVSALRRFGVLVGLTRFRRASMIGVLLVFALGVVAPAYALIVGDPLGIVKVGTTSSDNPSAPIAVANGGTTSYSPPPCLAVITCPNVGINTTGSNGWADVAVSGTGYSVGFVSASGTNASDGDVASVSGTKRSGSGGSGGEGGIAVSGLGSATGNTVAVSGTGTATAGKVAISGTGYAYAPIAVSGGSIIP